MNITWKIVDLEREASTGFVQTANWNATAIDGEYSARKYLTVKWSGTPVIPFDQLTEDIVLGWVWEIVNKEEIEEFLAEEINKQKNPTTLTGLPWSNA